MQFSVQIVVEQIDATQVKADILALKYAQAYYGLDSFVANKLIKAGHKPDDMSPEPGNFCMLPSPPMVAANKLLLIGVPSLREFEYSEIRELGRRTLSSIADIEPDINHIVVTVHGVGYGLDEAESFESQIAGFIDAIKSGDVPEGLKRITFAERNQGRAQRLKRLLYMIIPEGLINVDAKWNIKNITPDATEKLRSVGYSSSSKKHVFVAMPFKQDMEDIYDYGISSAVRAAGFLCERADLSTFTGDVIQWVRDRIKTATLVIADLTESNPNVYLEVGYAWGCGVPTVLLVNDSDELKFDVRGQRCIIYSRIKDIEEKLGKELLELRNNHGIKI